MCAIMAIMNLHHRHRQVSNQLRAAEGPAEIVQTALVTVKIKCSQTHNDAALCLL